MRQCITCILLNRSHGCKTHAFNVCSVSTTRRKYPSWWLTFCRKLYGNMNGQGLFLLGVLLLCGARMFLLQAPTSGKACFSIRKYSTFWCSKALRLGNDITEIGVVHWLEACGILLHRRLPPTIPYTEVVCCIRVTFFVYRWCYVTFRNTGCSQ